MMAGIERHHRSHFHGGGPAGEDDSSPPPRPPPALKKGPWSAAEDAILTDYVRKHGEGNWNAVQRNTTLQRCGKSCRLRWANHLRPNLKKGAFSPEEERLIIDLHAKLGNKWARISAHLPGRTDNEVKNYWNTRVKRRLRQGLPLYPHNQPPPVISSDTPPQPPLPILPLPPPLPLSLPHLKTPPSSLSLFDPISLPFPSTFFSFQQPSVLSPATRRYNCYPSPAVSIRDSLLAQCIKPFGFDSHQTVPNLMETEPLDPFTLGFEHKLELPSNEFCPKLASDDDDVNDCNYEVAVNGAKFIPNTESRPNSGLLDALLHEAQSRAAAAGHSKEKKDEEHEDQWDLSSANSASDKGANTEEPDDHAYCMNEDLSSILNLIPSPARLPKDEQENSAKEPSNLAGDDDMALDLPQLPHILANTEWLNGSVPYASWDNLPRIC